MVIITPQKTCPDCLGEASLTNWKAPTGYDVNMRQYICDKCGNVFYVIGGPLTHDKVAAEDTEP